MEDLERIRRYPREIKEIKDPSKKMQMIAIHQNGTVIQFINDPDKDVQLAAVQQNATNIQFIKNPDKEVKLLAAKQNIYCLKRDLNRRSAHNRFISITEEGIYIYFIKDPVNEMELLNSGY